MKKQSSILLKFSFSLMLIVCMGCPKPSYVQSPETVDTKLILSINELTYSLANQHDQFYSFKGVRALAMVHLAIHDILNTVDPQYELYQLDPPSMSGDPGAAAIAATQSLLSAAYPNRRDTIEEVCTAWLSQVPKGTKKIQGERFGNLVAIAYIKLRKGDGHEKNGSYTPMTKPGDYQFTPGFDWVWKPDFSVARPFTLDSITQFRSPPPPPLDSKAYAEAYKEVKEYGRKDSPTRSEDETHYAHWWAEFGEHGWNRIGRITAKERSLSSIEANRMFALINMNLYDLYLVSFESKYFYDSWRPVTAIRQGENDNNPLTEGDPDWEPEMVTPPWPDYPSTHAAVGASGASIVEAVFGTLQVSFTMESVTALPDARIRSYEDLNLAAEHCARSRIMNGFHFRFATEMGLKQGRAVAEHTVKNYLKKL